LEDILKIDGGCHCGLITYEAEVDPEHVEICHCTDCQSLSGSAFRVFVPASADVPCGFTMDDLPVGLQIVGPIYGDAKILRAAHAYQKAFPTTDRQPEFEREATA
jgi:hypothetical protein